MKLTKSKQFLTDAIHASGKGWPDGANWAAQDKVSSASIGFYRGEGKPICRRAHGEWTCAPDESDFLGWRSCISGTKLSPNWHQTCLSREEYFSVYPEEPVADADGWIEWKGGNRPDGVFAEQVDVRLRCGSVITKSAGVVDWCHFDNSSDIIAYRLHKPEQSEPEYFEPVTLSIPEPAAKPTIEQLAADYRNKLDYASRKQQEADDAKTAADAALGELVAAGWVLGLAIGIARPEPEPVITRRCQLELGDVIWIGNSGSYENDAAMPEGEYEVVKVGTIGTIGAIGVLNNGSTFYPDFSERDWKFIRRP